MICEDHGQVETLFYVLYVAPEGGIQHEHTDESFEKDQAFPFAMRAKNHSLTSL